MAQAATAGSISQSVTPGANFNPPVGAAWSRVVPHAGYGGVNRSAAQEGQATSKATANSQQVAGGTPAVTVMTSYYSFKNPA